MSVRRLSVWNDEFDDGSIERLMVCIHQDDLNLVRSCRKGSDNDGISTGVRPMPRRVVQCNVKMTDARRQLGCLGTKHRHDAQVVNPILDERHAASQRFGQRWIGRDLRWRLRRRPGLLCLAVLRCRSAHFAKLRCSNSNGGYAEKTTPVK